MELVLCWAIAYALVGAARRLAVDTVAAVRAPANTLTPPAPSRSAQPPAQPAGPATAPAGDRSGGPRRSTRPASAGRVHRGSSWLAALLSGARESLREGWDEGWEKGRERYQGGPGPDVADTPTAPTQLPTRPDTGSGPQGQGTGADPADQTQQPRRRPSPRPRQNPAGNGGANPAPAAQGSGVVHPCDGTYCLGCEQCKDLQITWRCDPCGARATRRFATEDEARADAAKHKCEPPDPKPDPQDQENPQDQQDPQETPTENPSPEDTGGTTDDERLADVVPLRPQFAEYATPQSEGATVSDTSGDIANIVQTRAFFAALERAFTADVQQIELALANLAEMELDQQTLGNFQSTQEDVQRGAARCRTTIAVLDAYHRQMEEAVNATPDAAKTEFYQPA